MRKFLEQIKTNRQKIEDYARAAKGQEKEKIVPLLAQMNSGKGIAAIGALCPLFWISIFSGQSIWAIAFNFCHSMIYVVIGLFMYFTAVKKSLNQIEVHKSRCTRESAKI